MSEPIVTVGGSFKSGLIITADRPHHLDPTGRLGKQTLVLTPAQSESFLTVLEAKWKVESKQ